MAKAGLSFGSPVLGAMNLEATGNPYDPQPNIGLGNLGPTMADLAAQGEALVQASQFDMPNTLDPKGPSGPQVMFSPATNKMFVNGAIFDVDDAQSALDAKDYLKRQPVAAPEQVASDWTTVDPESFRTYIQNIRNPGYGRLFAENFSSGYQGLKALAGRGLQFLGAEETGQSIVDEAAKELYKNQPFQREWTKIDYTEGNGLIDWFVAALGQAGPSLIETVGVTLVGAGVGAAAGGGPNPFTAVGGALAGLTGRTAFKQSLLAAAKKYGQGKALTVGEKKLLREWSGITAQAMVKNPKAFYVGADGVATLGKDIVNQAIRRGVDVARVGGKKQAMAGGATTFGVLNNYAMGVSDIYGEQREQGMDNRLTAAFGAIPYALLETIPEALLAGRIFGNIPGMSGVGGKIADATTGGGRLRRTATGITTGGVAEGTTEAGQEYINMLFSGQLDGDPEAVKDRLINAFAAGFAVGAPIGGIANNLKKGEASNLLDGGATGPRTTADPIDPNSSAPNNPLVPAGGVSVSPFVFEGEVVGPELPPPAPALPAPDTSGQALPAPPPPVTPAGPAPDFVAGQEGVRAGSALDTPVQVTGQAVPAQFPGQQGVLNIFGDETISNQELAQRMDQPTEAATPTTPQQSTIQEAINNQQMQLPLENPLTAAVRSVPEQQTESALAQQLRKVTEAREAQLTQELQAERERAERQRQFDEAIKQRQEQRIRELEDSVNEQIMQESMPTIPLEPRPPQQLPLFPQGTLPRVPYAEKLKVRRQRAAAETAAEPDVALTPRDYQRAGQGILFTQQGEPSVAALRAAGRTQPTTEQELAPTPVAEQEAVATQTGRARLQRGRTDAVQEQSPTQVDVREQPEVSQEVREGDTQERQATGQVSPAQRLRKAPPSEIERQEAQVPAATREADSQQVQEPVDRQGQDQQEVEPVYDSPYEAWEDLAPEGAVALDRLPQAARDRFVTEVAQNRASIASTKELYDEARADIQLTELELLDEAIQMFEGATTKVEADYAAETIMDIAFFDSNTNLTKPTAGNMPSVRDRALAWLNNTEFAVGQRAALDKRFVYLANLKDKQQATYRGKERPWFMYAKQRNLLNAITAEITMAPEWYKSAQQPTTAETVAAATEQEATTQEQVAEEQQQEEQQDENEATEDYVIADDALLDEEDMYDDYDDSQGMFMRVGDNTEIRNPLDPIKIRNVVNKFLRKLKVKPTVTIVKNVDDLRVKNPELYNRAANSNKEFGQVRAMGFSVGDQIIIFSDFIRTEDQARFVLAHETLGHFGFRALLPKAQFQTEMRYVFDNDQFIRNETMRKVEAGMEFYEAVEETLADVAAAVDVSVMKRLWYKVKNILNAIGFSFDDDVARYLISRARKNLRSGGSSVISGRVLRKNLERLTQDSEFGRFSIETSAANIGSATFAMHNFNKTSGVYGGVTGFRDYVSDVASNAGRKVKAGDYAAAIGELLERVQTLDNKAARSYGLSEIFKIFQDQAARVRSMLSAYENLTTYTHSTIGGPTQAELEQAGELLAYAALHKAGQLKPNELRDLGRIVLFDAEGNPTIDPRVVEKLESIGELTIEDFQRGVSIPQAVGSDTQRYVPEFEITENIWRVYQEQRAAVNESAKDVVMSVHGSVKEQQERTIQGFKKFVGRNNARPTTLEIQTIKEIMRKYKELYETDMVENESGFSFNDDSAKRADAFIAEINRALWKSEKLADWKAGNAARDGFEFKGAEYQSIINGLERLHNLQLGESQAYKITNSIADMFMLDVRAQNAEALAKQTIAGAYVPFSRRGKWQIVTKAYDQNGNAVELDDTYRAAMPYFRAEDSQDANSIASNINDTWNNQTFDVLNADGNQVAVTFRAEVGKSRQSKPIAENINMHQFVSLLQRMGANITPQVRANIIKALANENARVRSTGLKRFGSPGWDKDVVRSISEYLETQAHVAGKGYYQHKLNEIMLDDTSWKGDPAKLDALQEAIDTAPNEEARVIAQQEYDRYARMYRYMADKGARRVSINGKTEENKGRGEDYREEAKRLISWYSENADIANSSEDLLSGEVGSRLKLLAVLLQLGGSVAAAFINMVSMVTHSIPYLSTYNPNLGFGGGFGMANAASAMARSSMNMKNPKLATSAYLNEVVDSAALQDKHGLSEDEAQTLRDLTFEGVLQAAMFNALIGSARGKVRGGLKAGAIKGWMSMFSYTEQLNRRSTALAAYRLERDRYLASGATLEEAQAKAKESATRAVNKSQGEYAMYNRPEMARGNVLQYVFMYKQFTIISVQLLRGMANKERAIFLGMLLLMAGVKGIPFADDLFDLVDTLAQKFGVPMASIEKELATFVDAVIPGASPVVMRGLLDQVTGWTFSTRLGFGDLVPLSGAFKAGADPWREAENFAGPVWSGLAGMVGTSWKMLGWGAGAAGIKDQTTTLIDVLRDAPVSGVRGLFDGYTYLNDGRITNAQGKVVTSNASYGEAVGRMLGFYPARATLANDVVRMSKEMASHAELLRAGYRTAYVKAKLANDRSEVRRIIRDVAEWNKEHRGTEYMFPNFVKSAERAYQAARMPTAQRYMKFAPKGVRPEAALLAEMYGLPRR
jgi:hypothetical protein